MNLKIGQITFMIYYVSFMEMWINKYFRICELGLRGTAPPTKN